MNIHGFLKELTFEPVTHTEDTLVLSAQYNEQTLTCYPFKFEVLATYKITGNNLETSYEVKNLDTKEMIYGFGLHPAFNCNIHDGETFEDFYIEFNKEISINAPVNAGGNFLDLNTTIPLTQNSNKIALSHELFANDAILINNIDFTGAKLCHKDKGVILDCTFEGFDIFTIWQFKNSPFVCFEPWTSFCGIHPFPENLEDNHTMKILAPNASKMYKFTISI